MSEHHADFVLESREHLATFEQSLLALEKAQGPDEVRGHIDRSLRAIHSLKGDAGFLGFRTLRAVAHAMESLLEIYRGGGKVPPSQVVETLLAACDHLGALVEDLAHSSDADVSETLMRLDAAAGVASGATESSRQIDIDLTAASAAANGRLGALFARLDQLGAYDRQRLEITGDLLSGWSAAPVRLVARLKPRVAPDEVDRVLGIPVASSGASAGPDAPRMGDQRNEFSDAVVYPVQIDLGAWSQRTSLSLATLFRRLAECGRLVSPQLAYGNTELVERISRGPVELSGEIHSLLTASQLAERLQLPALAPAAAGGVQQPIEPRDAVVNENRVAEPQARSEPEVARPATTAAHSSEAERVSSLRVNVELLDRLMTLVGELTLVRNQSLLAFVHEEGAPRAIIQRLNAVTSDLQDTVLRTRMQPVGNLFGKFPRMVRDLARQLGKQVEVVTVGREVELDKTVLEQLSDPLTHLIRNSIDHGIESPEVRVAAGKPATGLITLTATPADGQVQIEIRDDGRGIDPQAVRTKALALRLKTEAELERMSPKDLFSLILLPGFSTAKAVTEISGRGVGMDVVKTNVEQLEGSLSIDSALGQGTSMLLRVPLTLAIIPCLIVDVGTERYAVPQRELEEVVCLHPGAQGAIEQAFDSEVYRLRDQLLPIVRFQEVLARNLPFTAATKAELLRKYVPAERNPNLIEYIVVLRSRGKRFGLLVDGVRGTQEVVVKPMHPALKRLGVFAGATLMGDGRVALIPNVDGIVEHASCFGTEARAATTSSDIRDPAETHRVLIFESGPLEQFALPLVQIRRIEAIEPDRIEFVGDQEFVTLDGTATRVVRLDKVLNVSPCNAQSMMYLVLPKFVPEPMGILISRIVDTDTLAIKLQQATIGDAGVLGTAIVRGKLSLFLDIQYIRERVFGASTFTEKNAASPQTGQRRVLLIDDTPFFRQIVQRYLEAVGIQVTTAVDGQDGLNKLAGGTFDLIVCDIEMPNMDGWEFARTARERGCRLPMLALTSLSRIVHEARAKSCGFDEFQEKLDHDLLLNAVRRLLRHEPVFPLRQGPMVASLGMAGGTSR